MIIPSILNNIFENREFNRFGKKAYPENYYNFSFNDYILSSFQDKDILYRAILKENYDKNFINFIKKNKIDLMKNN